MPKVCPVCGASYTDNNVFCPTDGSTLRAAEAEGDLIGSVIADRYLVTDLLGEGGMGKVYLARHVRLPQQAAIKVLRPAMLRDPDAVARFNREAANASRIDHERIARVFDYGESSDGTVYLAMEYVPGRTLKALLAAEGPQKPERAARLTRQIADALDAAHRLEIVHRDLKPDNVMVIEDDVLGDRCKVVDFGIAKALGSEANDGGLTKTGFVVGTPEFMSPEQLLGGVIDHRSDVYALALLSYQCFTGALPFVGSTPERAMTARLVDSPQSLALALPDVRWPAAMEQVFAKGLARDASDRYGSAGAFAEALETAVTDWQSAPVVAGATTVATPAAGSAAQPPASTARAATPDVATRSHSAPPNEATAPGSRRLPLYLGGGLTVGAVAVIAFLMWRPAADAPANPSVESPPPAASTLRLSRRANHPPSPAEQTAPSRPPRRRPTAPSPSTSRTARGTDTEPNAPEEVAQTEQQRAASEASVPERRNTDVAPSTSSTLSGGDAARLVLDSIRGALDPLTASESDARRGVSALRSLMPRLVTAEDSAWAYLREAEAHFLMVDERSACLALRAASPLVRTSAQRGLLSRLSGFLSVSCGDR